MHQAKFGKIVIIFGQDKQCEKIQMVNLGSISTEITPPTIAPAFEFFLDLIDRSERALNELD